MTFQHLAKGFSLVSFSLVVSFSVSCSQSGRTESPEAVADGTFNYGASKELPQALEH